MVEYAFTRERSRGVLDARQICDLLESAYPGVVDSATVAGHTDPFVTFVRCTRELAAEEKTDMGKMIGEASVSQPASLQGVPVG
jgi:hypothetical protein